MLSIISKHPVIKGKHMLHCPVTALPPYVGTLKACRKAQLHFERKLTEEFEKISEEDKEKILDIMYYYKYKTMRITD